MDLARRGLGQLGDELDESGEFVLGEALAGKVLQLPDEDIAGRSVGDHEGLDHQPAGFVGRNRRISSRRVVRAAPRDPKSASTRRLLK